jgi:hypothetical protein
MKSPAISRVFHLTLLRSASILVPATQRAEWRREWRSELWHVRHICAHAGSASRDPEREVTAFCLGAFQDALFLRRQSTCPEKAASAAFQGSAAQCILFLAAVLAASYAIALMLPGVRAQRIVSPRSVNPGVVLIQSSVSDDETPTISPGLYRAWKDRKQRYFESFAFYRVTSESVGRGSLSTATHPKDSWQVARASSNLFQLLGLPILLAAPSLEPNSNLPSVILSERIWAKEYDANPHIAGSTVRVGLHDARIVGITPDSSRGLPGNVDVWMLQSDSEIVSSALGYAVGHLNAQGESEMWRPREPITGFRADQSEEDLLGVSLDQEALRPWTVFLFAALLAFLALPAITSVSLGESSVSPQQTSWSRRLFRWGFLSTKISLLLPIVYFVPLDLAYSDTTFRLSSSIYIQFTLSFLICLFGMGWLLRDQRQRCPVCLRCVTNPASVGQASRTFLAWNGTEMMCMSGHTLLHVPGLPTSWFSTQRWLYLDASWEFLFVRSGTGMENEAITGFLGH